VLDQQEVQTWKLFCFTPDFTHIDVSRVCIKASNRTTHGNSNYKPNEAIAQQRNTCVSISWLHSIGDYKALAGPISEILLGF